MHSHFQLFSSSSTKAFTLVEVLVVMSIFITVSIMVLAGGASGRGNLQLTNVGYELAVMLRQAQSYGVAVRGEGSDFDVGYGVYAAGLNGGTVTFFSDIDQDRQYSSGVDTVIETLAFPPGIGLDRVCVLNNAGSASCSTSSALVVTFQRPNPEAVIRVAGATAEYPRGQFYLKSSQGYEQLVEIYTTGQISVPR